MEKDTISFELTKEQARVLLLSVRGELEHSATSDWFTETLSEAESRVTDAYQEMGE